MSTVNEDRTRAPLIPDSSIGSAGFDSVIVAAREGADWAWSHLYQAVAGPVLGYLRVQGAAEPEDLVGETFLSLARNIKAFDGDEANFRSWAFTVAHSRLIDERRARGRKPVTPVADPVETLGGDVEDEALEAVTAQEIRVTLDRLPEGQRDVLVLRYLGGFTVDEIASMMGKRPGAIKAVQRRAVKRLRRLLATE